MDYIPGLFPLHEGIKSESSGALTRPGGIPIDACRGASSAEPDTWPVPRPAAELRSTFLALGDMVDRRHEIIHKPFDAAALSRLPLTTVL